MACLCTKYHFSEGELSETSYSNEEYIFYTFLSLPILVSGLLSIFFLFFFFSLFSLLIFPMVSRNETPGRFLSAKWTGLHAFSRVLKSSRHLKCRRTFFLGKYKLNAVKNSPCTTGYGVNNFVFFPFKFSLSDKKIIDTYT